VSGGTKAHGPFWSLAAPTLANATTATVYTNSSTLYIGGAPVAGANITITNPYSLYVAGGASYFGGTLTANTLNLTNQLTTAYGGTGLTSYTAGDLPYYATGTALSKLGIGTNGQILTSSGSAPQWTTLSGVAVTTFSAGTTGFTPNSATSGAVTLGGTLATTNGGTGLTSFTANGVVYASSTSALATGSALTFDGTGFQLSTSTGGNFYLNSTTTGTSNQIVSLLNNGNGYGNLNYKAFDHIWSYGATEQMRLTTTGLGIGTSSPASGGGGGLTLGTTSSGKSFHVYSSSYANNGLGNFYGTDGNMKLQMGALSSTSAYVYANTGCSLVLFSGGNTSATLDSSGNLGLGVTPSASPNCVNLELPNGSTLSSRTAAPQFAMMNNAVGDWYAPKYKTSAVATMYLLAGGQHQWYNAPSGTAGNAITFTQAMTLSAAGYLGVGVSATSPSYYLDVRSGSTANTASFVSTNSTAYTPTAYNGDKARIFIQGGGATGATLGIEFTAGGSNESYFGTVQEAGGAGAFVWQGYNGSAYAERMRLDSSGNLGLGVTPSAWKSTWAAFQLGNRSLARSNSGAGDLTMVFNGYFDSTDSRWEFQNSGDYAARYSITGAGIHSWYTSTAAGGSANDPITFTQAMTLDSSGNLGIGTSSPGAKLEVNQAAAAFPGFKLTGNNSPGLQIVETSGVTAHFVNDSSGVYIGSSTSFPLVLRTNNTERARIDSSGNFCYGVSSFSAANNGFLVAANGSSTYIAHASGTASGATYSYFYYNNAAIGSITQSGTTAVLYNVTSDQRLKENIVDAPEFGSVIDSIQVRSYDWKADGNHQRAGFIAQELVTVAPEAVHQPADPEEMMAVDYSKLVPMLVKEIQSLRQRLADAGIA
jgi:hypothetical protein